MEISLENLNMLIKFCDPLNKSSNKILSIFYSLVNMTKHPGKEALRNKSKKL